MRSVLVPPRGVRLAFASLAIASLVLVLGCAVERPDPRGRPYPCGVSADCLDGFACVDRTTIGEAGFCAPACDPTSPELGCAEGVCTADGACLDRCAVALDGNVIEGCPSGLTCVRIDAFREEGVCYEIEGCSVDSDCPDVDGRPRSCLVDTLGIPAVVPGLPLATNRLFCVDAPQGPLGDRCPEGSVALPETSASAGACLPTCDAANDACPPSLACLRDLGWIFGVSRTSVCSVGAWGVPCEDETDCLFGRCLEVPGGRRVCTERCADVPDCGSIAGSTFYGSFEMRCEAYEGDAVCVPRGGVGTPCRADMPCLDELRCFLVQGESTGLCTRPCADDRDCALASVPASRRRAAYCDGSLGVCLPREGAGASCRDGRECLSGRCAAGVCAP